MAQLGNIESEVLQMIQERKLKIKDIKDTFDLSKKDADRVIAYGLHALTALMRCIEKWQDDFNQTVKENLKCTEKQAEDLIQELEQEIEDLTNRSSELKPLSHTEDHLQFLQAFRSLKDPPSTRDWTTVEVHPPSYVGTLRRYLDQLVETLNKKLRDTENSAPEPAILVTDGTQRHRVSLGLPRHANKPPHPGNALAQAHQTHPDSHQLCPCPASAAPAGRGPSVGPTAALCLITRVMGRLIFGVEEGH
ncbi:unnamed protein product [Gadus morhua 'NCC']